MSKVRISDLSPITSLASTDLFLISDGSTTNNITWSNLQTIINAGISTDPVIEKTMSELWTLMQSASLDTSKSYKITDFVQNYEVYGGTSVYQGSTEVLLVKPATTSTLYFSAKSLTNNNDVVGIEAGEFTFVAADHDNISTDVNFNFKITYRLDVLNNVSTWYDWRTQKSRRYTYSGFTKNAVTVSSNNLVSSITSGITTATIHENGPYYKDKTNNNIYPSVINEMDSQNASLYWELDLSAITSAGASSITLTLSNVRYKDTVADNNQWLTGLTAELRRPGTGATVSSGDDLSIYNGVVYDPENNLFILCGATTAPSGELVSYGPRPIATNSSTYIFCLTQLGMHYSGDQNVSSTQWKHTALTTYVDHLTFRPTAVPKDIKFGKGSENIVIAGLYPENIVFGNNVKRVTLAEETGLDTTTVKEQWKNLKIDLGNDIYLTCWYFQDSVTIANGSFIAGSINWGSQNYDAPSQTNTFYIENGQYLTANAYASGESLKYEGVCFEVHYPGKLRKIGSVTFIDTFLFNVPYTIYGDNFVVMNCRSAYFEAFNSDITSIILAESADPYSSGSAGYMVPRYISPNSYWAKRIPCKALNSDFDEDVDQVGKAFTTVDSGDVLNTGQHRYIGTSPEVDEKTDFADNELITKSEGERLGKTFVRYNGEKASYRKVIVIYPTDENLADLSEAMADASGEGYSYYADTRSRLCIHIKYGHYMTLSTCRLGTYCDYYIDSGTIIDGTTLTSSVLNISATSCTVMSDGRWRIFHNTFGTWDDNNNAMYLSSTQSDLSIEGAEISSLTIRGTSSISYNSVYFRNCEIIAELGWETPYNVYFEDCVFPIGVHITPQGRAVNRFYERCTFKVPSQAEMVTLWSNHRLSDTASPYDNGPNPTNYDNFRNNNTPEQGAALWYTSGYGGRIPNNYSAFEWLTTGNYTQHTANQYRHTLKTTVTDCTIELNYIGAIGINLQMPDIEYTGTPGDTNTCYDPDTTSISFDKVIINAEEGITDTYGVVYKQTNPSPVDQPIAFTNIRGDIDNAIYEVADGATTPYGNQYTGINAAAESVCHKVNSAINIKSLNVTGEELNTLITNSNLVKGASYRITDHVSHTITNGSTAYVAGSTEVIIVKAKSATEIFVPALSETFGDEVNISIGSTTYLAADYDDLTSDVTFYTTITYRNDTTRDISAHFDWRVQKSRRFVYSGPVYNSITDTSGNYTSSITSGITNVLQYGGDDGSIGVPLQFFEQDKQDRTNRFTFWHFDFTAITSASISDPTLTLSNVRYSPPGNSAYPEPTGVTLPLCHYMTGLAVQSGDDLSAYVGVVFDPEDQKFYLINNSVYILCNSPIGNSRFNTSIGRSGLFQNDAHVISSKEWEATGTGAFTDYTLLNDTSDSVHKNIKIGKDSNNIVFWGKGTQSVDIGNNCTKLTFSMESGYDAGPTYHEGSNYEIINNVKIGNNSTEIIYDGWLTTRVFSINFGKNIVFSQNYSQMEMCASFMADTLFYCYYSNYTTSGAVRFLGNNVEVHSAYDLSNAGSHVYNNCRYLFIPQTRCNNSRSYMNVVYQFFRVYNSPTSIIDTTGPGPMTAGYVYTPDTVVGSNHRSVHIPSIAKLRDDGYPQTQIEVVLPHDTYVKNGGWVTDSLVKSGTTADRPAFNIIVGRGYFDTTLGKPIWYDGTNWVDSAGTTV